MDDAFVRPADDTLRRIQGEFLEMPGLRLTELQARRLWGLDAPACAAVLSSLVEDGFLFRTRDGSFMRVDRPAALKVHAPMAAAGRKKVSAA